ncbi:hypothetical protein V6N12_027851 [Hibiscus sabdariffa]|uniref:Uncharacterized protein n=1 Tax=Hibiscus sabdariffa TaxID=183260 RepID=A0ABR2F442_9ROSI
MKSRGITAAVVEEDDMRTMMAKKISTNLTLEEDWIKAILCRKKTDNTRQWQLDDEIVIIQLSIYRKMTSLTSIYD